MIDLRSDFLSRPTPAMLEAMAVATSDDQGYGPREDPNQQALEKEAAKELGKEEALFVPTCMMANLLAVMSVTKRGDAVVLDAQSHALTSESGAIAAVAGTVTRPIPSKRGRISLSLLAAEMDSGSIQQPRVRCVLLENTHNKGGGIALPCEYFEGVRATIGPQVWIHVDGSRIFNAAVALGMSAKILVAQADSVSFSLNKGLAAPAGAMLVGPANFIDEATRIRQQLGGGWRPVGMLAAAALVGLKTLVPRMTEDHAHARLLAEALATCKGIEIDMASVQTNIVRGRLQSESLTPAAFQQAMADNGVRLQVAVDGTFRLVTYLGITSAMVAHACMALGLVLGKKET